MTMLQRKFIGIFVKRTSQNTLKSSMSMLQKEQQRMKRSKYYGTYIIQCDNVIEARQPDLIVIVRKEQKGIIIDIVVPADVRVEEKEKKVEKYQDVKKQMRILWKLRNVEIVSVVIGVLGSVSAEFDRWMGKLGIITCNVGIMQKTALLGIARILRKVLEM